MLDVSVHPDFDFRAPEYAELFARSDATAFQHPLWLHHLYAVLVPASGAEPLIVVVRHGGRLAMVLPLLRRRRGPITVVEFADLGVSDYCSPVCDRVTFALFVEQEAYRRQIRNALGPFDRLRIEKVRGDGLPLGRLLQAPLSELPESAHAVPLYGPYPEWRSQFMHPAVVREIERKWRQLQRIGTVDFEQVTDIAAIGATLDEMRVFRANRFEGQAGKDLLQEPDYFRFYRDVATSGAGPGFTRLFRLLVDGRIVAADFGLAHRRTYLALLGGFDLQAYKNRSVGMLLVDAMLAHAVARGDICFDLTIGDEAYKQLFGPTSTKLYAVATEGTVLGSLATMTAVRLPRAHLAAKRLFRTISRQWMQIGLVDIGTFLQFT